MLFTVRDNGKPINVAYSGGAAFQLSQHGAELRYLHHFPTQNGRGCSGGERTILMSNHTEFDSAVPKIRMLALRKPGEPHSFDIGKDVVARYFTVTAECAQAACLKLLQPPK